MQFEVNNRLTGAVQFVAEIERDENASVSVKIGLAVKWAVKAGADLAGADLAGANLAGANLARADLARADLARADLAGAYLARANLARANLARADLAGAYLAGADFTGANLAGADFTGANLARADLAGADLAGANLAGAYLAGAYLAGAYLIHAGTRSDGYEFHVQKRDDVPWLKAGCRYMPLADARAFWGDNHRDAQLTAETMALIDNAERLVAIRWPELAAVKVTA